MNKVIFAMLQNNPIIRSLAGNLKMEIGLYEIHNFPDGETYIRINSDVKNKIIIIRSLDYPNNKIIPLLFMVKTFKKLGAERICLLSPYLPYMRQYKKFKPGEAIASLVFAQFISGLVDIPEMKDHTRTPVIVDDIISTGTSMYAVMHKLSENQFKKPVGIGIHALFKEETYKKLIMAGVQKIISCNMIPHPSNHTDITAILLEGIKRC